MNTDRLMQALDATWPAAEVIESVPGWRIRRGEGGGRRVSSATGAGDIAAAEAAMRALGQTPTFQLSPGDPLDKALENRGYALEAPTVLYAGDAAALAAAEPKTDVRAVQVRTRLVILDELWDRGGIGAARRAVMARAKGPKVTLMARTDFRPGGVAFVAVDGDVAMIHAIEVDPAQRRQGAAAAILAEAARFALANGAPTLALAVTEENAPARALYSRMGMAEAGGYHYRVKA